MMLGGKTFGTLYSNLINKLIDTDQQFDEMPDEFFEKVSGLDGLHNGQVEVYKYNDEPYNI